MQGDSRQGVEMIIVPKAEKKVVHRRKDFKVVIMLATMDANKFQEYFDNCPLVHIAGRNFHVDNIYTAEAGPNFIVLAARVVIDIHENEKPGDILVFLPGEGISEAACGPSRSDEGRCLLPTLHQANYDRMVPSTEPAIRTVSVDSAILRLVATGYRKAIDFDWIDAPHPESIARAAQDLRDWGYLKDDAALTPSGHLAAKCPLDPIWYRARPSL
ncbi:hypothetical protein G6O67_000817 [Ophiocordyceps sinensis]|uniref:Uncharacterized protein n=1 Tax=Ophiocordyceps sinensis TaxID=72228 RepID=A0A8H4Q016_9HYPO|nr:hypothetical protein G6O67_000817 [Ophiocordyceps sinensis]